MERTHGVIDNLLTRDQILSADDATFEVVEVPEWKGSVRVKGLTGTERDQFEASMLQGQGKQQRVVMDNIRAKLVALTIVDKDGKRMFGMEDVTKLGLRSSAALDRVYEVAARLSKITKEDVDEIVGNSGTGLGASSSAG